MRRACVLASIGVATAAHAQVPGTGDDPVHALAALPSVVDAPLADGVAVRGGAPDETVTLIEGFEVPWLLHTDHDRIRSIVQPTIGVVLAPQMGVGYGRGTNMIALTPQLLPYR